MQKNRVLTGWMRRPWEQWGAERKVHHAVMRRTLLKGLEGEMLSQEGEAGWPIGRYSLRVTFRLRGQRCWKYRIKIFPPPHRNPKVLTYPKELTYIHLYVPSWPTLHHCKSNSRWGENRLWSRWSDWRPDRKRQDKSLGSNLNVLSCDCHWHSYKLACISTICQTIPFTSVHCKG